MRRMLMGGALFVELAIIALFAIAVKYGRFDQGIFFFVWLLGVLAAFAAAPAAVLDRRLMGKVVTHGALVVGCIAFAFPFAWLVTTSFKYDEEIFVYPPKWVPSVPGHIVRSPYVTAEVYEAIERPDSVDAGRWAALWPKLEAAIWRKGRQVLGDDRAEGFDERQLRPALVHGLYVAASKGVAREAWLQGDQDILDAVTERIDDGRVDDVWNAIHRYVALRELTVKDVSLVDHALGGERGQLHRFRPAQGSVRLVRKTVERKAGAARPLILEYGLTGSDRVAVAAELPLPVDAEQFLSVTVPLRQDRSWQRLRFELELAGVRYVPEDSLHLGQRRWQDLTFKIKSRDPRDERDVGIWPLVPSPRPTDFDEPRAFRLTLGIEKTSRLAAVWRKYADSYRRAYIATEHRWHYVFNSFYLVVLNVIGQLLSCSMVAYAFARLKWPGRDVLFGLLLATMMLPPQVTMIPVFIIFKHLGWYNTLKALWVPSFLGGAFFTFLLRQFMKTIPVELEDAAKIDGCGFVGVYWRIILPLLKPALAAVAIFTFMGTWNNFMGPLIYINDQRLYPLALGLFDFRTQHGGEYGMLMAASTMMTLPVIAIFFLAQKYFIQGVTLTGLKG